MHKSKELSRPEKTFFIRNVYAALQIADVDNYVEKVEKGLFLCLFWVKKPVF